MKIKITGRAVLIAVPIFLLVLAASWIGIETYTVGPSFCGGTCHTMTEQYNAWKADKHHANNNPAGIQANCVDCHFLPGDKYSLKAKYEGLRHLAAYLYDPNAPLPIRPVIPDGACLRSGCHADRAFEAKMLPFGPKAKFKHEVHLGDKALDGHKLTCDTCHFKVSEKQHFEVPKEICYLCHLNLEKPELERAVEPKIEPKSEPKVEPKSAPEPANTDPQNGAPGTGLAAKDSFKISFKQTPSIDFNVGKSRCDICHVIPTNSLQAQLTPGDTLKQPITHQSIKKAGVPCESCHFEVVKGQGEIETGNVVSNGCLTCHNRSQKLLETSLDKELMHASHVPAKADCFDCHRVIEHKNRTDHLDFVREDCSLCHQDQHKYQKLLLAGIPVDDNASATPHLMFNVNVNCMACHTEKKLANGHSVRTADAKTCVACHKPGHDEMLADWKNTMLREIGYVVEAEQQALEALIAAKGKLDDKIFKQATASVLRAQELLNIVRYGNGVHNKKYSINILDEAITTFEDVVDIVENSQ